jgi:hypothetical protein
LSKEKGERSFPFCLFIGMRVFLTTLFVTFCVALFAQYDLPKLMVLDGDSVAVMSKHRFKQLTADFAYFQTSDSILVEIEAQMALYEEEIAQMDSIDTKQSKQIQLLKKTIKSMEEIRTNDQEAMALKDDYISELKKELRRIRWKVVVLTTVVVIEGVVILALAL